MGEESYVILSNRDGKQEPWQCNQINKRVLGQYIVYLCGNEGTKDDSNNAGLRRLLQKAISVTADEQTSTLQNAEFKFYDDACQRYIIRSGDGENKFTFTFNEKLEPDFTVQRKSMLLKYWDLLNSTWPVSAGYEICGYMFNPG
ncbi:uncharacterized protein LOC128552913 isoform X2 [Mercenaria mercenaria]|uniref:uncharacterized protein LOC128552913 isoform X2 n=1 Tax=Mercenaria mercenaria TaxID=6596 RepID=UPI00234E7F84|nr:uncharacterized protein LOC128552913 isoform X2 [Mercenaria mercenaria]